MLAGDLDATLGRPGCGSVEQVLQFGFGLLCVDQHPSILGRSHQEERAHLQTALQKGIHIGIAVGHMTPRRSLWWGADLLRRSCPHLTFSWSLLPLSAALFAPIALLRSRLAHPGGLMQ